MNPLFKVTALVAVLVISPFSIAVAAETASPAMTATMIKTGTRYKADADMQKVLDAYAALGPKPIESLTAIEARQQPTVTDAVMSVLKSQGRNTAPMALVPGISSTDQSMPGAAGEMPVRIYTPAGAGPFPVIVYYHGGGWVLADKNVYDGGSRGLSKQANANDTRIDLLNANLKGLPPITVINAQIDPLRSDGDLLVAALKAAGVKVEHRLYPGVTHEFFGMAAVVVKAKQAQLFAGQRLKKSFAKTNISHG